MRFLRQFLGLFLLNNHIFVLIFLSQSCLWRNFTDLLQTLQTFALINVQNDNFWRAITFQATSTHFPSSSLIHAINLRRLRAPPRQPVGFYDWRAVARRRGFRRGAIPTELLPRQKHAVGKVFLDEEIVVLGVVIGVLFQSGEVAFWLFFNGKTVSVFSSLYAGN